jgi:GntR family transcriptional regulator / MocR family aminotransferase
VLLLDGKGLLHAQLTRALKAGIETGRYAPGSRLPATRWLATELGLSRNTVLAAYEQLRAEGFLHGHVGSGSYVAERVPTRQFTTPAPAEVGPQSAYAARARAVYRHDAVPGRAVPGMRYSFQYGVPLTNPALTTAWAQALSRAARYTRPDYPGSQGVAELREAICDYLARRRGIEASPEDVLVVAGTQQAVALSARVLLDPGETAVIEDPHYFAIRMALEIHGARVQPVPVDAHGLPCDALPAIGARLVCVTPSHQFPSGIVMPLSRRLELLENAARCGSWILEDDYDGEFRYDSKPLPALRALDRQDRVIYVGTFSKAIFPALRLGYLLMPRTLREDFVAAKFADDMGSPAIEQVALASFMRDGGFERHLRRVGKVLEERRAALIAGLRAHGGDRLEISDSHAGMHLVAWLRGRSGVDGEALIELGRRRGLGLYPIAPLYAVPPDRAGLLMGYCGLSTREIGEATEVFGSCLDALPPSPGAAFSETPTPRRPAPP